MDHYTAPSTPPNQAAAPAPQTPPAPAINPLLLASACSGYLTGLNILLNSQGAAGDEELPFDLQVAYASSGGSLQLTPKALLEGVTAEGDTALHAVANNGDDGNFLSSVDLIYNKAKYLLFVQNKRGDTALHLAARAGKSQMVVRLIDHAKEIVSGVNRPSTIIDTRVKALLGIENKLKETVLHEAVRVGSNHMVELLMEEYPGLARFPQDGTSPLYLAIILKNKIIAETMYVKSGGVLSYSGPNGQNALHAAVGKGPDLTKMLLTWHKDLTTQGDENGSTPLHFAAGLQMRQRSMHLRFLAGLTKNLLKRKDLTTTERDENGSNLLCPKSVCQQLLEANPAALYQSDHAGLYPIHIAASLGSRRTVSLFVNKSPSSAGLRDAEGRTFLHVAVEESNVSIVHHAHKNQSLSWIFNMRDSDGNTAVHLAVQKGNLPMFCALLMNSQVDLNLTNDRGQTPLDISRYNIPTGLCYGMNSEVFILWAFKNLGATDGSYREDHFRKYVNQLKSGDGPNESEMIKDVTQNMSIGSVLIATVTFGANFALPGGYRADDHVNRGTSTLAGSYASDAFMVANTLSFICSSMATIGFMYSGSSTVNLSSRRFYLVKSEYLMSISISSLAVAFALATYMVLAPVAYKTAIAICIMSSPVVLHNIIDFLLKFSFLVRPYLVRNGLIWTFWIYARIILLLTLKGYWPIMFSFGWAAYVRTSN